MYKIKRFARANVINNKKLQSWRPMDNIPNGAIMHPDVDHNEYSKYIVAWEDPSNKGHVIDKFEVIKGTNFKLDMNKRNEYSKRNNCRYEVFDNLKIAIDDIYNGYVFIDNDSRWKTIENGYDSRTHMLRNFCNNDKLVFSKSLNNDENDSLTNTNRLTYEVLRPELNKQNQWVSKVILNNFLGHRYNGKTYLDTKTYSDKYKDLLE